MPIERCPHCGRSNEERDLTFILAAYLMIMKQEFKIEMHGLLLEDLPLEQIHIERSFDESTDIHAIHFAIVPEAEVPNGV